MQFQRAKQFRLRYEQRFTQTISSDVDDDNPEIVYKIMDFNAVTKNQGQTGQGYALSMLGSGTSDPNCVGFQDFTRGIKSYRFGKIDSVNVSVQCTGVQLPAGQYRKDKQLEVCMFDLAKTNGMGNKYAGAKDQNGSPYDIMKARDTTKKGNFGFWKLRTGMKYHNTDWVRKFCDGTAVIDVDGIHMPANAMGQNNWNESTPRAPYQTPCTFRYHKADVSTATVANNPFYYWHDQYRWPGPIQLNSDMINVKYYTTNGTSFPNLSYNNSNAAYPRAIYWAPLVTNATMDRIFNFRVVTYLVVSVKDWFPYGDTATPGRMLAAPVDVDENDCEPDVKKVKTEINADE